MKTQFNTIHDLINKLDKLTFNDTDGQRAILNDNWKVSLENKLISHDMGSLDYKIQVIVRVFYKSHIITTWGCISNRENSIAITWFKEQHYKAYDLRCEIDESTKREGKNIFNNL